MSTLLWPVGPEPPGVYWRRRIVVLIVFVLVVLLLWWLFFGRSSGSSAPPTPVPTSSSSSGTPTAAPTSSSATGQPTSASPSPTGSVQILDCQDSDILVEASTELQIYPVGSTPQLTLTVTNIGTKPCKRDVGPKANELRIQSGDYGLWSSDDCNPSEDSDIVTLDRGSSFKTQIIWDGSTSQAGCPPDQPMVEAGEYQVVGRNGEVTSVPSGFRFE